MGLETVGNGRISELVDTNPVASDKVNKGDDHIRNIKKVLKDTFSGINAENGVGDNLLSEPVTANSRELNILDGATLTTDELNILDDATVTTAELNVLSGISADLEAADLNILDGVTATTDELNYVEGVTSAIQDQIDSKQDDLTAGNNITIDAVTENDVTTTTITASGTPFVVAGDTTGYKQGTSSGVITQGQWNSLPIETIVYPSNTMSGSPAIPTGVSLNSSGDTLTLPEGSYYFEAWADLQNQSYEATVNSVKLQLWRDGTKVGYSHSSPLREHDTFSFPISGMFTVAAGGQDIRLRVYRSDEANNAGELRYGEGTNNDGNLFSLVKVWKL